MSGQSGKEKSGKRVVAKKESPGEFKTGNRCQEDFIRSCGNVFADLGLPHADLYLKAAQKARTEEEFQHLCREIPGNED